MSFRLRKKVSSRWCIIISRISQQYGCTLYSVLTIISHLTEHGPNNLSYLFRKSPTSRRKSWWNSSDSLWSCVSHRLHHPECSFVSFATKYFFSYSKSRIICFHMWTLETMTVQLVGFSSCYVLWIHCFYQTTTNNHQSMTEFTNTWYFAVMIEKFWIFIM